MGKRTFSELSDPFNTPPSKLVLPTLDRRRKIYKYVGWLYVLRNPGLDKRYLKIGMSSRFPEERALELSRATAIPTPFQLIYYVHVGDRFRAEKQVHAELDPFRLASNKEFFVTSIATAVGALDNAAQAFPVYLTTSKGRVIGIFEQDIQPRLEHCSSCGQQIRVRSLLVPTIQRCGHCKNILGNQEEDGAS